ncbi:MAG: trigger factor [Streptosporangiaceae bacterium]|nr:trigger factor [Streptosporangiaceae bacterium]MBV9857230.1 trigger factor [Streptosporangiaceae bacterium]
MKTAVEELSPTRVRLSVEVPFDELKPSLDKAYREVARQVRIPGFRPGRVPPPVIDRRVGRAAVLSQAVNDALPEFYSKAVQESDVLALGQPDVEITQLDDGKEFTFTAEVEVRPKFELPDLATLTVTVDNAVVTPDEGEEYLNSLRERFASLRAAQRPAQSGDYTTIDLSASVDGKPVEDAQASGLSYEIGSGSLLDGLDDALIGMSAGESATFTSELAGGELAGREADVTVTVHSVKVKDLPELDDDFAQLASEFDTLGELRADTRRQLERMKRLQQAAQARDHALDALLASVDIPLPEGFVAHETEHARQNVDDQLERADSTLAEYLAATGQTEEQFEAGLEEQSRRSVKASLILDEIARQENLQVDQNELSYFIADQAQRMGVAPEQLARRLADAGQLGSAAAEVIRGKTLALITERVKVLDESGNEVDVKSILAPPEAEDTGAPTAEAAEDAEPEDAEPEDADAAEDAE